MFSYTVHISASKRRHWVVPISKTAENTFNPIRNVVDTMKIEPNPDMEVIRLTVGTCGVKLVGWLAGWVGWLVSRLVSRLVRLLDIGGVKFQLEAHWVLDVKPVKRGSAC